MTASANIDPVLKPLFAKVLDRFFLCEKRLEPAFTDFYDPAKWTIFLEMLKGRSVDVQIVVFGGMDDCERRMIGFFPKGKFEIQPVSDTNRLDFPITLLRIGHNSKFNKAPRHQDYLGSLIGLGFDRGKIGDIVTGEEYTYVFAYKDIAGYICSQLERVGKVPVKVQEVSEGADILKPEEKEEQINVASLRLDVVVAAMFRLSRGQVSPLIAAEKVFVNWSPCLDKGKVVKPGDVVTLRGHGRARVGEILGSTKKERLRVSVFRGKN